MTTELPLFPLGSVLFPGVVLPLHIFEHRYRQLVRDLSALPEGAPRRFGVLAIKDGHEVGRGNVMALYDVGCTAEIDSIVEYEDGRFDITTTGVHRFRLEAFDDEGPYARGEVELLDEVAGPEADVLAPGLTALFRKYQAALSELRGVQVGSIPELPEDPTVLSYLIGAATVLDTYEKQRLLTTESTVERLRAEAKILRRETGILKNLPSLPAVDLLRRRSR
ncbi:peptidase S16 lon domain protein [Catenulispora acidiphila DSM 44928]|uniref:Peptidase S16 lon domain protein n=1 Tax=Catenulispora acidiphila (strain DSM 44928 / JCM 14897 / NBRC 102108 / NRRL B-24433 / ID139908) TaxID=479433 RepID=C7QCE1_CATAD|nr:LON peptidase substrate-binding domain-containing protein [Catenulispora acidiphila]ACU74589.1 peptidase S16 lon domain protein [Catenulispora acidiphila DSM 44928]